MTLNEGQILNSEHLQSYTKNHPQRQANLS